MDADIIEGIVTNLVMCFYALPVIILGMWLSTKSWFCYLITLTGISWTVLVVCNQINNSLQAMDAGIALTIVMWFVPVVLFICLNVGTIFAIQAMRTKEGLNEPARET